MEDLDFIGEAPRRERVDAARNRRALVSAARAMLAEVGADKITLDGLAERAGLGKGTVHRHFGTKAGIFLALLDDEESDFQHRVLSGPPPLGPGADPVDRLIAFGRARIEFLVEHHVLARGAMGASISGGAPHAGIWPAHIRMLLRQAGLPPLDLDSLSVQLASAMEGPGLLYLSLPDQAHVDQRILRLADSWQLLVDNLIAGLRR
ncbi:TetR/AcrR family transcriptional regulator [Amycolatopsis sp. NPDC003731]